MSNEELLKAVEKAEQEIGRSQSLDFILDDMRNHIPITSCLREILCIGFGRILDDDGNEITKDIITVSSLQYHLPLLLRSDIEILIGLLQHTLQEYDKHDITDNYIRGLQIQELIEQHKEFIALQNTPKEKKAKIDSLYLVRDTIDNTLKIGRSQSPKSRLQQLQTSTSHKLELLFVVKDKGYLEEEVHKHFTKIRLASEWFENDGSIIKYFEEELL